MFLASLFLKTKLSRNKIFGLILGATGALVLVLYQKELGVGPNATKGNLMVLGNTAAYAVFLVMMKPMLKKYNPLTATFWVYIFASIIIFPIGLQSMTQVEWPELLSNHGFSLFYIIVLVTFGAYFLSVYSLQHLSPTAVSFYIYLQPVFAFIIAVAIGDQLPSVIKIAAAMLIFTGVYFVNQAPKRAHNKMD
jgi:drug/metabolite transporter (DMT)-like permease